MVEILSVRGLAFLALFTVLALIGMQMNFSKLVGAENQFFTMFQFFGPIAGGFLGVWGAAAVMAAQLVNFAIAGKEATMLNLARLLPMLFAAYYFSQSKKVKLDDRLGIAVPLLAMTAFWLHPIGQQAWYYALFWTVPILVKFLPDRLFLRSLGATFTAHAVGGAFWVWTVPMTVEQWNLLIPVTAFERLLFASGIAVSYVLFTNVLNAVDSAWSITRYVNVEKRYVLHI
jgi:hypothetical protein